MKPNNPFLIAGYYSPEFFCDRKTETDNILDALYNGRNLTLFAQRRMGKTCLIHNVFYHLEELRSDIVTLYMDIYPTRSLSDFVSLFAYTVLGKLDSTPQKALGRCPVLTFDEMTGAEKSTLKEIFDYLGSSEKRFYIAIDEFQQIAEYPEKGVEGLLRSYIQFLPSYAGNVCIIQKTILSKHSTS